MSSSIHRHFRVCSFNPLVANLEAKVTCYGIQEFPHTIKLISLEVQQECLHWMRPHSCLLLMTCQCFLQYHWKPFGAVWPHSHLLVTEEKLVKL